MPPRPAFLFLYPKTSYLEPHFSEWTRSFNATTYEAHQIARKLNETIDQRYRQNGFTINWLFYSTKNDPSSPDLEEKFPDIDIRESDKIIASGISFDTFNASGIYPDPRFVHHQLSSYSKIVLGGFHHFDCVKRLNRSFHNQGIDTSIDSDTTDLACGEIVYRLQQERLLHASKESARIQY